MGCRRNIAGNGRPGKRLCCRARPVPHILCTLHREADERAAAMSAKRLVQADEEMAEVGE